MAKLDIEVGIKGAEKLKTLEKDLKGVEVQSVAVGNVFAQIAIKGAEAFARLVGAGSDYLKGIEEINDSLVKTVDLEDELTTSLGMAAGSILENTGAWNLYREALVEVSNILDVIAGKEAIARQAQAEHILMEKEYQELLKAKTPLMKANEDALKAEAKAQAEVNRQVQRGIEALAKYEGQQAQKVAAHKEELEVLNELVNIYEEQGRNTDELITKIERLEQVDVLHVKTIREKAEELAAATQETKEYSAAVDQNTDEIQDNTQALDQNTNSLADSSSATERNKSTLGGGGRGEQTGQVYGATDAMGAQWERYLREIAESSRDTNDAVRGY